MVTYVHTRVLAHENDLINVKGSTKEQREFNTLAPYLMQSVNMDSDRARQCRL